MNKDSLDELLGSVNGILQNLKSFKDFNINANIENDKENLLSKIFVLTDDRKQSLNNLGYGVQFTALIILSILEKLLSLYKNKKTDFFTDEDNNENLNTILLALDEPEIHLHPYMQRSLIKYLRNIISNQETDFLDILKSIFNLDKLNGQMLVVSHSPNIILNDYKQIIRFCIDENSKLNVKSGVNSETLNIDFDELGISVIQAAGADSVHPLMELLDEFNVKNLGLLDRDQFDKQEEYKDMKNLFFTDGKDFEEDIYDNFNFYDYIAYLEEEKPDSNFRSVIGKMNSLELSVDYNLPVSKQLKELDEVNLEKLKNLYKDEAVKSLRKKKSIIYGRKLSQLVTCIPESFKKVILLSVELSKNEP